MTNDQFPTLGGITIKAPERMLDVIDNLIERNYPNEACALVFGNTRKESEALIVTVKVIREIKNLINSPSAFEIDPVEQFKIMEEERGNGHILIGILHTHPGSEFVSASDDFYIRNASKISNLCWFIAGKREKCLEVGAYMLVNDQIHSLMIKFF
ncbi:MAG: Mov34/MPN/PAD-1 family protein [Candidatus Hodarchaeota archaeon]